MDHLYTLWPIRIVNADEQGVLFSFGKVQPPLGPGLHWFCPGLQKFEKYTVVFQSVDCGTQPLETRDGIAISLSINVDYVIRDAVLMRTKFYNFDQTLRNIARGIIGEWVLQHTYADLKDRTDSMMAELTDKLKKEVYGSGVKIEGCRRDVFTRAKALNLMGLAGTL